MPIKKKKHYYCIRDLEKYGIIAGFTDNSIRGIYPEDALKLTDLIGKSCNIAYLKQVHGPEIHNVVNKGEYEGDGIFTGNKELLLFIRTADCLPIYFYGPKTGRIGLVHMGWRSANAGIMDNIAGELKDHIVIIGAGMRKCCYEVGSEFSSFEILSPYTYKKNGSLFFDPVIFIKEKLISKNVSPENIIDTGICSICSGLDIYSFRKENTESRTLSFISRTA